MLPNPNLAIVSLGVLLIVITGFVYKSGQNSVASSKVTLSIEKQSQDGLDEISPTPSPTLTPTPTKAFSNSTNTPTPTPTFTQSQNRTQSSDLEYPGSKKIKVEGNKTFLESNDDPQKITDWYKDKIKSMGFNAKSFVTTSANDNILNKLVGSDGKREIRIEIKKSPNESTVHIEVESKV